MKVFVARHQHVHLQQLVAQVLGQAADPIAAVALHQADLVAVDGHFRIGG